MMSSGDKVTAVVIREDVVSREKHTGTASGTVHGGNTLYFAAGVGVILLVGDEGLTWIRGHHTLDSEEVQALLAAHALTRHP